METLDDFEAAFYDGTTITKSSNGQMKVTDEDGRQLDLARLTDQQDVMCNMNTHFQQCLEHCQHLERLLRDLRTEGECFPIIVGRRPAIAPVLSSYKEYNTNMMTPRLPNVSSIFRIYLNGQFRALTMFISTFRCHRLPAAFYHRDHNPCNRKARQYSKCRLQIK